MKYLQFLFILLFFGCTNSNKINEELIVTLDYCKYVDNGHPYLKDFKLLKNEIEFRNILIENKKEISIPNLPFGEYKIEYKSIFNRMEFVEFKINDTKRKTVNLCIDKYDYSSNRNVLLIDRMKVNEVLNIFSESYGCFSFSKEELKIKKNTNGFIVEYNDNQFTISDLELQLIREFEIELRCNHSSGCSNTDEYIMFNDQSYESYSVSDESCEWAGFGNLIKMLKLEK